MQASLNLSQAGRLSGSADGRVPRGMGQGPGDGNDVWMGNTGQVPRNDKPQDIKANSNPVMATGSRRETGSETYIEVRGPASMGARSSVPYLKALPSYRKRAEEAIARKRIPKSKQKRVKEYFESLQRGKK